VLDAAGPHVAEVEDVAARELPDMPTLEQATWTGQEQQQQQQQERGPGGQRS
jgi:hypothetical protein